MDLAVRFLASFPELREAVPSPKGSIAPEPLGKQVKAYMDMQGSLVFLDLDVFRGDRRAGTPTNSFRNFAWQLPGLVHDASRCWFKDSNVGLAGACTCIGCRHTQCQNDAAGQTAWLMEHQDRARMSSEDPALQRQ